MNNEREIFLKFCSRSYEYAADIDMFLRIITSRDITVVKSLAQFIYCCFKQIKG